MFCLPTYEDCIKICDKTLNKKFYETITYIDGYKISVFNYRICEYKDFVDNQAFELRGLTFVFNLDGTLFKRFLLMEKFFNINENVDTDIRLLLNKNVKSVYSKEDGSLITFIKLPNGKIISKTKVSFESSQSKSAQKIYETNPRIKKFVDDCLDRDQVPIFEYVSPNNQIVLNYEFSELILLRLRDNINGEYIDIEGYELKKSQKMNLNLEELLSLKPITENVEGWVIEFEDYQKVKIKTDWYLASHKIFTEFSCKENYLINLILNEKIDDILNLLDFNSEKRNFVESVIHQTQQKFYEILGEVENLINDFNGDKKEFALKYKSHKYFSISVKCLGNYQIESHVRDWIIRHTKKLSDAQAWIGQS